MKEISRAPRALLAFWDRRAWKPACPRALPFYFLFLFFGGWSPEGSGWARSCSTSPGPPPPAEAARRGRGCSARCGAFGGLGGGGDAVQGGQNSPMWVAILSTLASLILYICPLFFFIFFFSLFFFLHSSPGFRRVRCLPHTPTSKQRDWSMLPWS